MIRFFETVSATMDGGDTLRAHMNLYKDAYDRISSVVFATSPTTSRAASPMSELSQTTPSTTIAAKEPEPEPATERNTKRTNASDTSRLPRSAPDPDIAALCDAVVKGRDMLKRDIARYQQIVDELDELVETDTIVSRRVADIENATAGLASTLLGKPTAALKCAISDFQHAAGKRIRASRQRLIDERDAVLSRAKQLAPVFDVLSGSSRSVTCAICLSSEVTRYAVPCGHCVCRDCGTSKCGICRADVQELRPIFLT
jgi:hypothetical protein